MHPDRQPPTEPSPLDDAVLAALVRDVADDWHMPPQRLDDVTWRDRVGRGHRAGGGGSGVRWTRRLFGAAAIAVVATVSLSFAAVWLTSPRGDQGVIGASGSPSPDTTPSAGPSAGTSPAPSLLPRLVQDGDLPSPSTIMVRTGGGYNVADLATGTLGPRLITADYGPSAVLARPGGGWVCVCGTWTQSTAGAANGLRLSLQTVDAAGVAGQTTVLKDIEGTYDPTAPTAMQPQLVDANTTTTPDGRYALVGWSRRDGHAGWVIGVDVLDLASLRVTSSGSVVIDEPVSADGNPRTRVAPLASLSSDGSTILLTGFWYIEGANGSTTTSGTDHWTNLFVDGVVGAGKAQPGFVAAGSSSDADCFEVDAGAIDKGSYYTLCQTTAGRLEVARVGIDGREIDTTELPQDTSAGGPLVTMRTADGLFLWDPVGHTITRFDFETAAVVTGRGEAAVVDDGVLDQLAALGRRIGHAIAPSALAKILLQPGMVASPDGSRIFALGVGGQDGSGGSTGVYAFDATTLASMGHWAPTADFSSIAINADGTAVYAASMGGVAADGSELPGNGASVTVYDSASGRIRVLAGQLGRDDLSFTEPVLR